MSFGKGMVSANHGQGQFPLCHLFAISYFDTPAVVRSRRHVDNTQNLCQRKNSLFGVLRRIDSISAGKQGQGCSAVLALNSVPDDKILV